MHLYNSAAENIKEAYMQNKLELSLLIDYYGAFLTDNQCEMLKLNCEEDFSLAEIAEQKGISRQGVRDALQRGEKILLEMEEKLGLAARDRRLKVLIAELSAEVRRCTFNETARERINTLLSQLTEITEGKDGI